MEKLLFEQAPEEYGKAASFNTNQVGFEFHTIQPELHVQKFIAAKSI